MPFDLKFYSNGSYTVDAWLQSLEEEYGGIDSVRILLSHLQSSSTVFSTYVSSCLLHNWHRLVPPAGGQPYADTSVVRILLAVPKVPL